jgi:urease accessory protein
LLHPPGGIVGGDTLTFQAVVGSGGHVLLTSPAATKFYRSASRSAELNQIMTVESGAVLEWLPQETIVFNAANVHACTRVDIAADAAFIGWESVALGRPASDEPFDAGVFRQSFELWCDEQPAWIDRVRLGGGDEILRGDWGLGGFTVSGTLLARPAAPELLPMVREILQVGEIPGRFAATRVDDILICRGLARQALALREVFERVWSAVRQPITGRCACAPRIWRT